RAGHAVAQDHLGISDRAGQRPDHAGVAGLAVADRFDPDAEANAFGELHFGGLDAKEEIVIAEHLRRDERARGRAGGRGGGWGGGGGHGLGSLVQAVSTVVPAADWPMRMIRNSAGFTGAMPMTTTTWPRSTISGGLVSRSHLTKKACSGRSPASAPWLWMTRRKLPMSRLRSFHNGVSLGSKITQRVLIAIDSSIIANSRRTLRYFQLLSSPASVRAPHTRIPSRLKKRMTFTPYLLSPSCSARETILVRPIAPRIGRLAGALWTPRVESVCAHKPAMWPEGGADTIALGSIASATRSHGK